MNSVIKNKLKRKRNTMIYHMVMIIISLIMIYPVLWMAFSSFEITTDIMKYQRELLPHTWTIDNYIRGWKGFAGITFTTFFKNSLYVTVVSTLGCIITSTLAAYAFSRLRFPFKKFLFAVMMLTMMLPAQVLMVPQYIMMNKFGWVGEFAAVIIPAFAGGGFYIYLINQFIKTVPKDLDEAAFIDGCTKYGIFFKIILPLMKPSITTATIFAFYWKWEDFMGPLLYLNKPKKYLVPLAIKVFSDPSQLSDWGALFAMATLSLVPVLVIFFLLQKYIVEGVATTGIKG